jgi:hypothetical protein
MGQVLNKSMVLDGIAASEAVDSSGEVLDIKGLDISELVEGRGVLNYEHRGDAANGASANDVIGHITYAKKIFESGDCANDRERTYWNKVQLPFLYIQAELFNNEGHPGAQAAAALIRYYQRRKLPILMRYSIEGNTLDRSGNKLKRAIAKRVAATLKPCNRSCISGVLSDDVEISPEKAPDLKDLLRFENDDKKNKLGGFELEFDPVFSDPMGKSAEDVSSETEETELAKAFEVGGFGAIGTLTQGSALQAESIGRANTIKNQTLAAVRDWRGRGDLRKFLKHRLPDASDEFIQHFADLVNDYQLKKMSQLEDDLVKAVGGKPVVAAEQHPSEALTQPSTPKTPKAQIRIEHVEAEDDGEFDDHGLITIRGKSIKPLPSLSSPNFDEKKGVLHTPRGSFPMYLPHNDKAPGAAESFHNILNDPKHTAFHDYATGNWMKVHKMLREGKVSPQIVMHSFLFSQLSKNRPVPVQELMYSHLVDSMKDRRVDARSKRFASGRKNWLKRDASGNYPKSSEEYYRDYRNPDITLKSPSKASGRAAGDVKSFMMPDNDYDIMSRYHEAHPKLMDLVNYHRHDARSGVAELMEHKMAGGAWNDYQQRMMNSGLDVEPYTDGPYVHGLAPKTARYMYSMMGGGNVHIPDTHFSRYLFGLEKGHDKNSINYIKSILWNPANSHILDGIDRYYAHNHPAVEHMMKHPVFGKEFTNREDAIFPAFWKNWSSIVPHERARGYRTGGANVDTDHRPFWEAISPFVKGEQDNLPERTAKLHAKWEEQYGEIPAQMMYYAYIVPMLLRHQETPIKKMERIASYFRKAADDMQTLEPIQQGNTEGTHRFRGSDVHPGEVEMISGPYKGSKFHFLGRDDKRVFVKPHDDEEGEATELMGLPADKEGMAYRITSHPKTATSPIIADANIHADPTHTRSHAQRLLVHGLDLSSSLSNSGHFGATGSSGFGVHSSMGGWKDHANNIEFEDNTTNPAGWYSNRSGQHALVKPDVVSLDWSEPNWDTNDRNGSLSGGIGGRFLAQHHLQYPTTQRSTFFHNMARDYFGLGQHVPVTTTFRHPQSNKQFSAQAKVHDAFHASHGDPESKSILDGLHANGILDKLGLMDTLMGISDRHKGNYVLSRTPPGLHLVDNDLALNYDSQAESHLWDQHHEMNAAPAAKRKSSFVFTEPNGQSVHPDALSWVMKLDPREFLRHHVEHGVPLPIARVGMMRMMGLQMEAMEHKLKGTVPTRAALINAANRATERAGLGGNPTSKE